MNSEPTNNRVRQLRASIGRARERRLERIQSRRRIMDELGPRRPGQNRRVKSLYDLWRLLWGPHESSPR